MSRFPRDQTSAAKVKPLHLSKTVSSVAARNLLRGMKANDPKLNRKIFGKLQREVGPQGFGESVLYATGSGYLGWIDNSQMFKPSWQALYNAATPSFIKPHLRTVFVSARLEAYSETVSNFISDVSKLDLTIGDDSSVAFSLFKTMVETYGWSLTLLSRLASLHVLHGEVPAIGAYISEQLERPDNREYANYYFCFYDLLDLAEHYGFFEQRADMVLSDEARFQDENAKRLVELIYNPTASFLPDCKSNLDLLTTVSLFDQAFFLVLNSKTLDAVGNDESLYKHSQVFQKHYFREVEEDSGRLFDDPSELYRLSAWSPRSQLVLEWRHQLVKVKAYRSAAEKGVSQSAYENNYFPQSLALKQLAHAESVEGFSLETYEPGTSHVFLRTFAFFHLMLCGNKLESLNPSDVKKVLSYTENIALGMTRAEIENFYKSSEITDQEVLSFFALCLLFDKEPSGDTEFAMRMQFQEAVIKWFEGDVVELLRWLSGQTPSLAGYVFRLCSSDFIDKLYLLVPTFEYGLELKESILRWASDEMGVEQAGAMADNIAKDRRIRQVRGERDDSRIFVDETWFENWIAQRIMPDLSRYVRSVKGANLEETAPKDVVRDNLREDKKTVANGQQHLLLQALAASYSNFCTHDVYGVRSFLGRRILHGTLMGHLLKPVRSLVEDSENDPSLSISNFHDRLMDWLSSYTSMLNDMQQNRLRIRSQDHPLGLISADLGSSPKKLAVMQRFSSDATTLIANGGSAADIAKLISTWCWAVVQVDLSHIQTRYLPSFRIQTLNLLKDKFPDWPSLDSKQKAVLQDIVTTVEQQHRSFQTWFRRPETKMTSGKVGTLVETILLVLQNADKSFKPALVSEERDITLFDNFYHVVYDILEILIGNVESWGKKDGHLRVKRSMSKSTGGNVVTIEVESEFAEGTVASQQIAMIDKAMFDQDLDSVTDQTSKTGIRRVRRLLRNYAGSSFSFSMKQYPTFTVEIPVLVT